MARSHQQLNHSRIFQDSNIPDVVLSGAMNQIQVINRVNSKTVKILALIDHDRIEDLDILFIAPGGTYALLMP